MTNNMENVSTGITEHGNGFLHFIKEIKETVEKWWISLPPWGRTAVSLGLIGSGTFIIHDALEHDCKPEIRIGNVLEMTMSPTSVDLVER